jgi:hypothetical protein
VLLMYAARHTPQLRIHYVYRRPPMTGFLVYAAQYHLYAEDKLGLDTDMDV